MEQVGKFKYLGIWLNSSLTFSDHVSYLKSKLYAKIKLLGRVQMLLDRKTALTIYKTLILPVLDYCDYIYYGISANDKDTLQKLQNCAFISILNADWYTHTDDTHSSLNMDKLDDHRKKHTSVQMYKFLKCPGPRNCQNIFAYVSDYHDVNTRASQKESLIVPKLNLSLSQRNIHYFGVKIWATVPEEINANQTWNLSKVRIRFGADEGALGLGHLLAIDC